MDPREAAARERAWAFMSPKQAAKYQRQLSNQAARLARQRWAEENNRLHAEAVVWWNSLDVEQQHAIVAEQQTQEFTKVQPPLDDDLQSVIILGAILLVVLLWAMYAVLVSWT